MIETVRVILTANVQGFVGGINRAMNAFRGFTGAIRGVISGITGLFRDLVMTIAHLPDALDTVIDSIEGFFGKALKEETFIKTMKTITGSADQAGEMAAWLQQKALDLGLSFEDLLPSAQQVAVALRSQEGVVDPAKWEQLTSAVMKFAALRPDVPIQLWGRAISGLLAGDATTLTRLLDVNVKDMAVLSDKAKAFLQDTGTAQEQTLGQVTRLGTEAQASGEDALAVLEEIMQAVGATDELLEEQADTTQGELNRLKAEWDNFIKKLAIELLPILNDALEGTLKWIEEHRDEIDKFIEAIGNFSADAWEDLPEILAKIPWDKLEDFSSEAWIEFANAIASIDWEKVSKTINTIVDFFNPDQPTKIDQFMQDLGLRPGTSDPFGWGEKARNDLGVSDEGLIKDLGNAYIPFPDWLMDLREALKINVLVSVDDDGKLKAVAEQVAEDKIGEIVDSVTNNSGAP